jgi:hypothetical protein
VTDYARLFLAQAGTVNSSLAIPNVVTATYTGVESITATLYFRSGASSSGGAGGGGSGGAGAAGGDGERSRANSGVATAEYLPPVIIAVADPTSSPFGIMGLTNGTVALTHTVTLPDDVTGRIRSAYVDVYNSNHGGSEEFWCVHAAPSPSNFERDVVPVGRLVG